jgi:hypothetical protein
MPKILFFAKDIKGNTSELGFLPLTNLKKSIIKILKNKCGYFLNQSQNALIVWAVADDNTICKVKKNLQLELFTS